MRTLVLGVGNPILTDDSVGIRVARELARKLDSQLDSPTDAGVEVQELYNGGLGLMESLQGYKRAILVDAMVTGSSPGTVREMDAMNSGEFDHTRNLASSHDTGLREALEAGRILGLDLPGEIIIIGIEAQDVESFSETLTPAVEKAVPEVIDRVMELLNMNLQGIG